MEPILKLFVCGALGQPCAVLGHVSNFGSCSQPSPAGTSLALIGLQGGMKRNAVTKRQTDKEPMSHRVVHKSA